MGRLRVVLEGDEDVDDLVGASYSVTSCDLRAKPAAPVKVGDTVRARLGGRDRILEVARLLDTRVGAELAAACLIDRSPPPPPRDPLAGLGPRHPGAGRPTKRDRRQLDQARGRRT
jgi:ribosome-associated heat shock protein Hsp15